METATTQFKTVTPIAALVVLFISSCTTRPEAFKLGKDVCDDCKMTIMDAKFGGEIITKKGRTYKFDDAHCLANFIKGGNVKEADIEQAVFSNYEQENTFLDSKAAQFVIRDQFKSPMKSNAEAFVKKINKGQKAKETAGTVKNWDELFKSL